MQKIIHFLVIHKSANFVRDAILTIEGLSNWWSNNVKLRTEHETKIIEFTFISGFNPNMKVIENSDINSIQWMCISGHKLWKNNNFYFYLEENGNDTNLKFIQEYAEKISENDYGTYNYNWAYYLQSLKEYCETGIGKPYESKEDN